MFATPEIFSALQRSVSDYRFIFTRFDNCFNGFYSSVILKRKGAVSCIDNTYLGSLLLKRQSNT